MRRRGYTAEAINAFCDLVGVTRRGNENIIGMHVLEHCIRTDLEVKAKRTMAILDPVVATIVNLVNEEVLEVKDFPKFPEKGTHTIKLTSKVYLDRSDVRTVDHEDFWGCAPGKLIGLK
jgi:glutaminyl-tRNA synthetase